MKNNKVNAVVSLYIWNGIPAGKIWVITNGLMIFSVDFFKLNIIEFYKNKFDLFLNS
jgi:hypothetical protein